MNKMIQITAKKLSGFWKVKGLLGSAKPEPIYFQTRFGIHTLGMKYTIDVIVLNDQHEVVKLKENLDPNRIFLWNPFFNNVIELPKGYVRKRSIKIGQKVAVTFT